MAELSRPSVLTIEQDQRWLRIERDSSFADLPADEQSGADVSQLGASGVGGMGSNGILQCSYPRACW